MCRKGRPRGDFFRDLRVDADRFKRDFEQLAEIGSTGDGGVNRPALQPARQDPRDGQQVPGHGASVAGTVLRAPL